MPNQTSNTKPENGIVGGFVRTRHREGLNIEVTRPDELSKPDKEAAIVLRTNKAGQKRRNRRTKLAVLGVPSSVLDAGDPSYARCVRLASAYRRKRCIELSQAHGYVSSGASALLGTAAMALAASRYLYEQAAKNPENLIQCLKSASNLADSARQNELAAWELCARESVALKKASYTDKGIPWMQNDDDSGYAKKKPGPKKHRKDEDIYIVESIPAVGQPLDGWIQSATVSTEVDDARGQLEGKAT